MRLGIVLFCIFVAASFTSAGETLFTTGPQEYEGTKYYWLAEWKLEMTLPADVAEGDRFEVFFGSKGPHKRTLHYDYDGRSGSLTELRNAPFEWIEIPLGRLEGGKKVILYGRGRERVGFLAGLRVAGRSSARLDVTPIRIAMISSGSRSSSGRHRADWSDLSGFEMNDEVKTLWNPSPQKPDWDRAERSSRYAGIALDKVQRWLWETCMPVRDDQSGLFRATGAIWNYRDTAADCYPFYLWAAFYTDQELLDTVMVETLEAEQRLCNHVDRLPVPYDMDAQQKVPGSHDAMIFGASEYAKDGLVPIVEITGPDSPWFERMRGIIDDIFKHARVETSNGKIPSQNIEVNGELLQMLPRLYRMTGDTNYLDWAHRLADHYLLTGGFVPSRLSDHGCEIIGGLGLLFAVDSVAAPEKCRQYWPHMEYMFDTILARGTNSDGVIIATLQKTPGPHDKAATKDGWGYDFVGFLDYDRALSSERYTPAVTKPLRNLLKPRYKNYNWGSSSRDDVADSVEGSLYLLERFPTPEGFVWADREIATLLVDHVDRERLWGTHKLEANTVRTVLIHTMLHTRNTVARPWQQGLQLGAAPCDDGICIFMKSDKSYEGRIQFDIPRHRIYIGFKHDWPRMNTVPEWFTVEPDDKHRYSVENVDTSSIKECTGESLAAGLPVILEGDEPLRLIVRPLPQ